MNSGQGKPRILYITCAENGLYGLKRMIDVGCTIASVVTLPPEAAEKYTISGYADVGAWTRPRGIPTITLPNYTMKTEHVEGVGFDLVVVNGWNRLIPDAVIRMARFGGLGVHAGHPPIGLGRAPLVWNILNGESDIEVYVFRLTADADDGPIMALRTVEICPTDDVQLLYEKVMLAGAENFIAAVAALERGETGAPQDMRFAVHYQKRTPEDGAIDFSWSDRRVLDFIRAQAPPYPGAFATLNGERWTILKAQPFDRFAFRTPGRKPGRILTALPSGIVVETGGAPVWLLAARAGDDLRVPTGLETMERWVGRSFDPLRPNAAE